MHPKYLRPKERLMFSQSRQLRHTRPRPSCYQPPRGVVEPEQPRQDAYQDLGELIRILRMATVKPAAH